MLKISERLQMPGTFIFPSRCAVAGKVRRLGLDSRQGLQRPTPLPKKRVRPYQPKSSSSRRNRLWEHLASIGIERADARIKRRAKPEGVLLVDLENRHCRFPVHGDGLAMLFCSADRLEPHSFCAEHCMVAFRYAPRARRTA